MLARCLLTILIANGIGGRIGLVVASRVLVLIRENGGATRSRIEIGIDGKLIIGGRSEIGLH